MKRQRRPVFYSCVLCRHITGLELWRHDAVLRSVTQSRSRPSSLRHVFSGRRRPSFLLCNMCRVFSPLRCHPRFFRKSNTVTSYSIIANSFNISLQLSSTDVLLSLYLSWTSVLAYHCLLFAMLPLPSLFCAILYWVHFHPLDRFLLPSYGDGSEPRPNFLTCHCCVCNLFCFSGGKW